MTTKVDLDARASSPPATPPEPRTPAQRRQQPDAKPFVSLLAAVSVLAGGSALVTTVDGASWVAPTVQIVGLVWLIGLGCRLLRMPAPVTVLAQAGGVLITLTAVFTSGGYGGIIPNARAVREAEALLTGAWDQILHSTVPAPATPQLGFLIAVALGLIALIVDFFVSEVDAPALVALPLLCLYSVPASIASTLLPWWTFALPAACYAALVALAGHPGRRVGLRAGLGVAAAGGAAVVISIVASLLVADSITQIGTAGRIDRTNGSSSGNDVGLSAFANLHGDLQKREARDLLSVTGLPDPDYLRITALENWSAGQGFSLGDPEQGAQAAGAAPVLLRPLAVDPAASRSDVNIRVLSFADRFVPIYQGTSVVSGLDGNYSYNPELNAIFRNASSTPNNYSLTVDQSQIDPAVLRRDSVTSSAALTSAVGVSDFARGLALSETAAQPTDFDRALALKNFFTDPSNGFQYSLSVPTGNSGDLLTDFLRNRKGYCEQYAAAMAIMLRSVGIPARVAIGFTQGSLKDAVTHTWTITSHDAHAWVEVQFARAGWVRFDPTPLSPAVAGQQGFQTTETGPSASDTASTSASDTAATVAPSGSTTAQGTLTETQTVFVPGDPNAAKVPFWKPGYTWTLVILLVLAVLVAVPSAWRRRRTARRLAVAAGGGPDAAAAAWAEVEDLAVDHGLVTDRGNTVRKAANQLARDGKLSENARAGLRRIALGTETSWYSAAGFTPEAGSDLAEDVRRIGVDLEHSSPRTLSNRLMPRSLVGRE